MSEESFSLSCISDFGYLDSFPIYKGTQILDMHYKTDAHIDHVVKFHGTRLRELGDPVAKEKKLKICGRAKLEAARCPKSDWKYNLRAVAHVKISRGNTL